jgi:hypothetical protein
MRRRREHLRHTEITRMGRLWLPQGCRFQTRWAQQMHTPQSAELATRQMNWPEAKRQDTGPYLPQMSPTSRTATTQSKMELYA